MDLSMLHLLARRRLWPVLSRNIFLANGVGVIFCKRLQCFKEALLISGTIFLYLACDLPDPSNAPDFYWMIFVCFLAVDIVNSFVWWCLLASFTPTLANLSASSLNLTSIWKKTCGIAKFNVLNSLLSLLIASIMSLNYSCCFVDVIAWIEDILSVKMCTFFIPMRFIVLMDFSDNRMVSNSPW